MTPHVIAVGPQGGQIVGYHGPDHKPVYAGSAEASKWELHAGKGSPAAAAPPALRVGVHATKPTHVQVSWPHSAAATAQAWLDKFGGAAGLPPGAEAHRSTTGVVLLLPREWAELKVGSTGKINPTAKAAAAQAQAQVAPQPAPAVPAGTLTTPLNAAQKAALPVWGVSDWRGSTHHPVSTPSGPGVYLGRGVEDGFDIETGKLVVRLQSGEVKAFHESQVTPADNVLRGAWTPDDVAVHKAPAAAAIIDKILAGKVTTSGGTPLGPTFADVLDRFADEGIQAFVAGGLVRDALQGKPGADVDFTSTAPAQQMRAAASKHHLPMAQHTAGGPGNHSGLLDFGHDDQGIDEGKIQGKAFIGHGGGYKKTSSVMAKGPSMVEDLVVRDFACNAIYYDHKNQTILDPSGHGVEDAINKVLRIPVEKTRWSEWAKTQPANALRYWKFIARGYTPADAETRQLVITECAKNIETHSAPGSAYGGVTKMGPAKRAAFKAAVIADMGLAWWDKHMQPKVKF